MPITIKFHKNIDTIPLDLQENIKQQSTNDVTSIIFKGHKYTQFKTDIKSQSALKAKIFFLCFFTLGLFAAIYSCKVHGREDLKNIFKTGKMSHYVDETVVKTIRQVRQNLNPVTPTPNITPTLPDFIPDSKPTTPIEVSHSSPSLPRTNPIPLTQSVSESVMQNTSSSDLTSEELFNISCLGLDLPRNLKLEQVKELAENFKQYISNPELQKKFSIFSYEKLYIAKTDAQDFINKFCPYLSLANIQVIFRYLILTDWSKGYCKENQGALGFVFKDNVSPSNTSNILYTKSHLKTVLVDLKKLSFPEISSELKDGGVTTPIYDYVTYYIKVAYYNRYMNDNNHLGKFRIESPFPDSSYEILDSLVMAGLIQSWKTSKDPREVKFAINGTKIPEDDLDGWRNKEIVEQHLNFQKLNHLHIPYKELPLPEEGNNYFLQNSIQICIDEINQSIVPNKLTPLVTFDLNLYKRALDYLILKGLIELVSFNETQYVVKPKR